ncbi:MAG TPA: hypothetical protein VLI90_00305, partial [Tepidisphaeraceae bacterium]|nr:hypothetical protein [Tepidisphaeraceae bacterium]
EGQKTVTQLTTTTLNDAQTRRRRWWMIAAILAVGIFRQGLTWIWRRQPKTPAELRAEAKQRQKMIRRKLRGLE